MLGVQFSCCLTQNTSESQGATKMEQPPHTKSGHQFIHPDLPADPVVHWFLIMHVGLESLGLIGFIWIRLDPLLSALLSSLVQGKNKHGLMEKKKGNVPAHGVHSVLTSQRYVAHARHDPKQFLCWGS